MVSAIDRAILHVTSGSEYVIFFIVTPVTKRTRLVIIAPAHDEGRVMFLSHANFFNKVFSHVHFKGYVNTCTDKVHCYSNNR